MNWRQFINEYFSFTKKERIGLLALVIVIFGVWLLPQIAVSKTSKIISSDTSWIAAAKKLEHETERPSNLKKTDDVNVDDYVYEGSVDNVKKSEALFYFDPNTISVDEWKRLGIREKTIGTIQKYLNKGGHLYKPDDLKKIYGIRDADYKRLEPYIKIKTAEATDLTAVRPKTEEKKKSTSKDSKFHVLDINSADTSNFIALPGIASKLAGRIVSFRDKLGGFYSIEQIGETYGLPDSTFQNIKPHLTVSNSSIRKININKATKDELKSHPYIRWNLANIIVEYRNQHGNFAAVDDLQKISAITEDVFKKMKPYLSVE